MNYTSSISSSIAKSSCDFPLRRMSTAAPGGGASTNATRKYDDGSARSHCKMSETRTFGDHHGTNISFTAAFGDESSQQHRSHRNSCTTNEEEGEFHPALSQHESQVFSLQTAELLSLRKNSSVQCDFNASSSATHPQFHDPNQHDDVLGGPHRPRDEMPSPGGNQDMRQAIMRNRHGMLDQIPPVLSCGGARSPLPRSPQSDSAATPWSRNRNSPSFCFPSPHGLERRDSASFITDQSNQLETLTSYSHVAADDTLHHRNSRNFTPLEPMKSKNKRNRGNSTFRTASHEDGPGAHGRVVQVAPTQDILASQFGTRADDESGTPAQMESGVNSFDDVTPGDSLSRLSTTEGMGNNAGFPWGIVSFLGWKGHPSRQSPNGNVEMRDVPKVPVSPREGHNPTTPQRTHHHREGNERADGKAAPPLQANNNLSKPHTRPAHRSPSRNADPSRGDFPSEVNRWSDFSSSNDPNGIQPFCPHRFYQQQYEAALLRGASPGDAAQRYSGLYPTGEKAACVTDPRVDGALDEEVPVDGAGRKALRKKRKEAEHEKRRRETEESRQRQRQQSAASGRRRPVLWLYEDAMGINSVDVRGAPHVDKSGFRKYMQHGMYMFFIRFFVFGVIIPFIIVEAFILIYQYAPIQLCITNCLCNAAQSAIYIYSYGLLFYIPQAFLSPLLFMMLQHGLHMSRTHYGTARMMFAGNGGADQIGAMTAAADVSRRHTGAENGDPRGLGNHRASTQNAELSSQMRQSGRAPGIHVLDSTSVPYRSTALRENESQLLYFYFYDEATERFSLLEKDLSGQPPQGVVRTVEADEQPYRQGSRTPRESEATRGNTFAVDQAGTPRSKRRSINRASIQRSRFTVVPNNNQNADSTPVNNEVPPNAQWIGKETETVGVAGRVYRCGWPLKHPLIDKANADGADVGPEKSTDDNHNNNNRRSNPRECFSDNDADSGTQHDRLAREGDSIGSGGNVAPAGAEREHLVSPRVSGIVPHPGEQSVVIVEEVDTTETGSESPGLKGNGLGRFFSWVGSILVAGGQLVVTPLTTPWDTNPVDGRASNAAHCNLMEYQSLELPPIAFFLRDPALWIIAILRFTFYALLDVQLPRVENMPRPLSDPIRMIALSIPLFVYSLYRSRPIDSIPFILMDIFPMEIQFVFAHLNSNDDTSIGLAFAWPSAVTGLLILSAFVSGRCLPDDAPVQVKVAVCFCFNGMATVFIHSIALFMNLYTQYVIFVVFFFEILLLAFITSSSLIPRINIFFANLILKMLKRDPRMMRLSVCSSFLSIFKHSQSISVVFSAVALAPTFQFMRWPQGSARTDCYGLINSDTIYSAGGGEKGTSWLTNEASPQRAYPSSASPVASMFNETISKNAWCSVSSTSQYLCDVRRDGFPNGTKPEDSSAAATEAILEVPYNVGTWESFLVLTAILLVAHFIVSAVRQSKGCLMAPTYPWDLWLLILVGCYIMRTTPVALSLVPIWHRSVT